MIKLAFKSDGVAVPPDTLESMAWPGSQGAGQKRDNATRDHTNISKRESETLAII